MIKRFSRFKTGYPQYEATFVGGFMDGERRVLKTCPPIYRFLRMPAIKPVVEEFDPIATYHVEEYELDSWEGPRVVYRRKGLPQR